MSSIKNNKNIQKGFTLVELMIVLTVVGVLLTLAVVSFSSNIQKNAAQTGLEKFRNDLNYARSEAVTTGKNVCMASSTPVLGNPQWPLGWVVDDCNGGTAIRKHKGDDGASTTITSDHDIKSFKFSPGGQITLIDTSNSETNTSTIMTFGSGDNLVTLTIMSSGMIE